jgi:hypothetical protein
METTEGEEEAMIKAQKSWPGWRGRHEWARAPATVGNRSG